MKEEKTNQQIHDELQEGLKPGQVRLHNKFHPTRWKKGFAQYINHQPFEYEIIEKGQNSDAKFKSRKRWRPVGKNHILIKPISIGEDKKTILPIVFNDHTLSNRVQAIDITKYEFWIARNFIRRGPNSWSIKKDRWIMTRVLKFCLRKVAEDGDNFWQNPFTWPFKLKRR